MKAIVEGLLFLSGEDGLTLEDISKVIEKNAEEVKSIIKEYESFMLNPNLTILKNIKFSSNDDLSLVVTDHYKMLNINIDKDQLTAEGIEDIIKSLNIIIINNSLENCELSINIILELFESKKLIEMYEKTIN